MRKQLTTVAILAACFAAPALADHEYDEQYPPVVAVQDEITAVCGEQVVVSAATLLANDSGGTGALYIANVDSEHGPVELRADGTVLFTPPPEIGTYYFGYLVNDQVNRDAGSAVIVTVVGPCPLMSGHASGGGQTLYDGHFGFTVTSRDGEVKGEFQFVRNGVRYHAHEILTFGVVADHAYFTGIGTDGRPFSARVYDGGQSGEEDTFELTIAGEWQTAGPLQSGNIRVRRFDERAEPNR